MIARGKRDGPVLGLTAALHGNELNGIPLIQALFAALIQVEPCTPSDSFLYRGPALFRRTSGRASNASKAAAVAI